MELGMARKHLLLFLLGVVLWLSAPNQVSFSGKIYKWVDETGNVGFTDDLLNIPEKFRNTATLESESAAPRQEPVSAEKHILLPSLNELHTDGSGHDRAYWQGRVKELQDRRVELVEHKKEIDQKIEILNGPRGSGRLTNRNYLKLHEELLDELSRTEQDIKEIDDQLENGLPEEARKANAPPGWLR